MSIQRYAAPMQMLNLSSKWLGLKLETCQSNGKQALIWCNELSVRALAEIRTPTIALCFNFERRFPASGAAIFPTIQPRWLIRLGFHGEDPRTSAARRTSGGCVCSKSASGRDRIVSEVFTVVSLWRTAGFDVRWGSAGCLCVYRGLSRQFHGFDGHAAEFRREPRIGPAGHTHDERRRTTTLIGLPTGHRASEKLWQFLQMRCHLPQIQTG
ncbi:hypothetical protein [Burkholderia ambifaria]|uniref:hypothetical protein n=1 Tax=Burkholderia ambifaria TaxID=152480 RepID=UPI001588C0CC|nr:hypothetical protein [Burkholderia ambifaria]MBR8184777.1 hypothetical protein [Burkholderia ambifaria]